MNLWKKNKVDLYTVTWKELKALLLSEKYWRRYNEFGMFSLVERNWRYTQMQGTKKIWWAVLASEGRVWIWEFDGGLIICMSLLCFHFLQCVYINFFSWRNRAEKENLPLPRGTEKAVEESRVRAGGLGLGNPLQPSPLKESFQTPSQRFCDLWNPVADRITLSGISQYHFAPRGMSTELHLNATCTCLSCSWSWSGLG